MKLFKSVGIAAGVLVIGLAHAGPVNINTADAKTLAKELKGVGPAKAAAIVAYRDEHGAFKQATDITKVPGIGASILEQNGDDILVKNPAKSSKKAKADD
ncbi:helix-hairpin-helix domain-containing protein [Sinimarinibacterium sp. NLF-5-8]|uniref:ComEA family DNA-binding protein n=1 Tax=Sinimarinibacterium sp. NLF-5-8 TaxID=2698684 RepID=UPI00137C024C|nr:helix-hairpin-helix domain-containing protein [Sinimarinibacterium sp. NLF-5-8]QHS08983.1 helix-hairpin-helix domain-containing protein [Sinimarinibacterium sp. NLF-5-8]